VHTCLLLQIPGCIFLIQQLLVCVCVVVVFARAENPLRNVRLVFLLKAQHRNTRRCFCIHKMNEGMSHAQPQMCVCVKSMQVYTQTHLENPASSMHSTRSTYTRRKRMSSHSISNGVQVVDYSRTRTHIHRHPSCSSCVVLQCRAQVKDQIIPTALLKQSNLSPPRANPP